MLFAAVFVVVTGTVVCGWPISAKAFYMDDSFVEVFK